MMHYFITDPPYMRRVSRHVDVWGLGLLAVGMGAFQIMLDKGQEDGLVLLRLHRRRCSSSPIVGLTAFVVRELRTREPIVDFHLFRYATFTTGTFIGGVLGFVLFGSLVLLPLFMQQLLGFPARDRGALDLAARDRHRRVPADHRHRCSGGGGTRGILLMSGLVAGQRGVLRLRQPRSVGRGDRLPVAADHPGRRPGDGVHAADDDRDGPDPARVDGVCHGALQPDPQHGLEHGDLVRDHRAGAAIAVPPGAAGGRSDGVQPGGAAGDVVTRPDARGRRR